VLGYEPLVRRLRVSLIDISSPFNSPSSSLVYMPRYILLLRRLYVSIRGTGRRLAAYDTLLLRDSYSISVFNRSN
jgi:hypothetical protein